MRTIIDTLNQWGDGFWQFAVAMFIQVTLLVILLGCLDWIVLRRLRAGVRYGLWSLVLVKLLLPASLHSPLSVSRWVGDLSPSPRPTPAAMAADHTRQPPTSDLAVSWSVQSRESNVQSLSTPDSQLSPLDPGPSIVPAAVASAHPLAATPDASISLRWTAGVLLGWLTTVVALLGLVAWRARQVRRVVQDAVDAPPPLRNCLDDCLALAEVSPKRVRLRLSGQLGSPAICGFWSATILIPRTLVDKLDREQMRLVLIHELAHWRRCDLQVNCLQTLLQIVYFYNPLVWAANIILRRLREQAVDEAVMVLLKAPVRRYSSTLVDIATLSRHRAELSLRLVGVVESRKALAGRIQRLVSRPVPRQSRLGLAGLAVVMLTGIVLLPMAGNDRREAVADDAAKQPQVGDVGTSNEQPQRDDSAPVPDGQFELIVLGLEDRPVAAAQVEVRSRPKESRKVHIGAFVRAKSYGELMQADEHGRLRFELANRDKTRLALNITTPGYAPFWAEWDNSEGAEAFPARYTARLDAGRSVGGIVVDGEGRPVEGASVHPSIQYKMREGDLSELHVGLTVKTDAAGIWRLHSVPAVMESLGLEISHPEYQPARPSVLTKECELAGDARPTVRQILSRGITVTGKVTDESGRPIAGALIRSKFLNDIREATTDESGLYHLVGCEPVRTSLVVTAKGHAPDLRELKLQPDLDPVDFELQPGRTLRVRVTDTEGNPVNRARVFFRRWRTDEYGKGLSKILEYTDESGLWVWEDAPADAIICDIAPPNRMTVGDQTLVAREEEYVFKTPPLLEISGTVADAATKKPIDSFRVIPGIRSSASHMNWARGNSFEAKEGTYTMTKRHPYFAYLVRIEANGYLAAVSRDIKSDEGRITIDFELEKGKSVDTVVLTPDGKPAAGAKAAMGVAGAQINIKNGRFGGSTYADRRTADEDGRFVFPPQEGTMHLVILHPAGFAHVQASATKPPKQVFLTRWAKVEGMLRIGADPAPNEPMTINWPSLSYGNDAPSIFVHYDVTTDSDGRFTFDRVLAGKGWIGRRIIFSVRQGAHTTASSHSQPILAKAGQTLHVDIGGVGRPVVGQLSPPEDVTAEVDWNFSLVEVAPQIPPMPRVPYPAAVRNNEGLRRQWRTEWKKTPEGQNWQRALAQYEALRDARSRFSASIARDGRFRIDDVPADTYDLTVRMMSVADSPRSIGEVIGTLKHSFTVPQMESNRSDDPLDLGTLKLESTASGRR